MNEITWNTIANYLMQQHEIPIPMCNSNYCVLVIRPGEKVELQLRTDDAFRTDLSRLPQLTRFSYENITTRSYRYLGVVCGYSEFDDIVLKFFNSIASNFVDKKTPADSSILDAYREWKRMLVQAPVPDEITLIGLWGELYIIDLVLKKDGIDPFCLVQNWTGPVGAPNDFSFGNSCVEIKTTTKQSSIVEISSIDQLDAKQAWIILLHVLHTPVDAGGATIGTLVNKIGLKLCAAALDVFQKRIDAVLPLYDLERLDHFSLKNDGPPIAVQVDDTYPVLTRARLSKVFSRSVLSMLINAKYTVDLADRLPVGLTDIERLFKQISTKDESRE